MNKTFVICILSMVGSLAFAGSVEIGTGISDSSAPASVSSVTGEVLSAVVAISNGVPPMGAMGEVVIKGTSKTLAVMSSSVPADSMIGLMADCDYEIGYKKLRFGVELVSIKEVPDSCGQSRLQAR